MDTDKEAHHSSCIAMWLPHLVWYLECNSWRGVVVYKEVGNVKDRYAITIVRGMDKSILLLFSPLFSGNSFF